METVEIDITENLTTVEVLIQEGSIVTSGVGEVNTASSAGGISLVLAKAGVDLPFKGLTAGTNITFGVSGTAITINAAAAPTDNIQNAAGTTGLFTEETANRLVGHSTGTGTSLIFEMFEGTGTPVSVFQIDGNGNLFNNGIYQLVYTTGLSFFAGTGSTHSTLDQAGATNNVGIGRLALNAIIAGDRNTSVGALSGVTVATNTDNSFFGAFAGNLTIGNYNSFFGAAAGRRNVGTNNIFIGYSAGTRQLTASNTLLINNYAIADAATELTDSIVYGVMSATVANQLLRINAKTELTIIPSGATQVASGATANQIWKTASHATLPDNVLMIGV